MKRTLLTKQRVLEGYDAVSRLYPHTPSLSLWRAWEYAAYREHDLSGPMLDVGCGDGRFCKLVWPDVDDVTGVDHDPVVVERARRSGAYREAKAAPAQELPFEPGTFQSVFANCSLEHVDDLPTVLGGISACLRRGGAFLFSVVTDNFVKWPGLSRLLELGGARERARELERNWRAYHHLANPLSEQVWREELAAAEFDVLGCCPIVPELQTSVFLLLDQLWHLPKNGGEVGEDLNGFFSGLPNFPSSFRQILASLLDLEPDMSTGSGAVFLARKRD